MDDFYNKIDQLAKDRAEEYDEMNKEIVSLENYMRVFSELEFEWGRYTIKIHKLRNSKRLCLIDGVTSEITPYKSLGAKIRKDAIETLKILIQNHLEKEDEE